jgi:hypothetical protein
MSALPESYRVNLKHFQRSGQLNSPCRRLKVGRLSPRVCHALNRDSSPAENRQINVVIQSSPREVRFTREWEVLV